MFRDPVCLRACSKIFYEQVAKSVDALPLGGSPARGASSSLALLTKFVRANRSLYNGIYETVMLAKLANSFGSKRTALRTRRRKACGFESHPAHTKRETTSLRNYEQ